MKILNTEFEGLIIIDPYVFYDDRGYFYESFNLKEFNHITDSNIEFVQDNQSYSKKGVIRGMHYQLPPYEQAKLVRVVQGKVLDVVVDIRKKSLTYGQYFSIELSEENRLQLFIPAGFAHGFITLSDSAIFNYKCSNYYSKDHEAGIKFDDKDLNIDWKDNNLDLIVSEKDNQLPPFKMHKPFEYQFF